MMVCREKFQFVYDEARLLALELQGSHGHYYMCHPLMLMGDVCAKRLFQLKSPVCHLPDTYQPVHCESKRCHVPSLVPIRKMGGGNVDGTLSQTANMESQELQLAIVKINRMRWVDNLARMHLNGAASGSLKTDGSRRLQDRFERFH